MTDTTINDTLSQAGSGLGSFLSAITSPLGTFLLYLGIIGGVIAIFMAVAVVIKRAMHKN